MPHIEASGDIFVLKTPKTFLKTLIKLLSLPWAWRSLSGSPPALHYIINIHLWISISVFCAFLFCVIALNCCFLHCFWWVDLSFWQENKQGCKQRHHRRGVRMDKGDRLSTSAFRCHCRWCEIRVHCRNHQDQLKLLCISHLGFFLFVQEQALFEGLFSFNFKARSCGIIIPNIFASHS